MDKKSAVFPFTGMGDSVFLPDLHFADRMSFRYLFTCHKLHLVERNQLESIKNYLWFLLFVFDLDEYVTFFIDLNVVSFYAEWFISSFLEVSAYCFYFCCFCHVFPLFLCCLYVFAAGRLKERVSGEEEL